MRPGPSMDDVERDPDLGELEELERDVVALEAEIETTDATPEQPVNEPFSG